MRRYWVPNEMRANENIVLTGDVLHHIRDVCRMHKGSKFEVIIEGGEAHLVEIVHEEKKSSIAKIIETRTIPPLPLPRLHLAMAIPKFPVFEAVIEKAVELGVTSVRPFYSEYSYIRTQSDLFDKKQSRFERIVQSATQQCGRGELMRIESAVGFDEIFAQFNRETGRAGLFAYEGAGVLTARDGVESLAKQSQIEDVWIFVGAEGGFSDAEVRIFQANGLKPVTLGPQVLRVETACVALIGIIKYGFDLMR